MCDNFFSIRKNGVTQRFRQSQVPASWRPSSAEPPCGSATWPGQPALSVALPSLLSGSGTEPLVSEYLEADRAQAGPVRKSNTDSLGSATFKSSRLGLSGANRGAALPKTLANMERRRQAQLPVLPEGVVKAGTPPHKRRHPWPFRQPQVPDDSALSHLRQGFKLLWS